jgi:uncharacterized protein YqeY
MREQIIKDITLAMKSGDKETLSTLRLVKGAMQMAELDLKRELNDEEVVSVITKQIKTRNESIVQFKAGNREDLINKTLSEIEILNKYMPKQLSEEEINNEIALAFAELKPESPKDMGKVIGYLSNKLKGKVDMSIISSKVKEKLNS